MAQLGPLRQPTFREHHPLWYKGIFTCPNCEGSGYEEAYSIWTDYGYDWDAEPCEFCEKGGYSYGVVNIFKFLWYKLRNR